MQETDDDSPSIETQSTTTETGTDSIKMDDDDDESDNNRIMTRQSPRKKVRISPLKSGPSSSIRRHSKRLSINQTKSRISSMCKLNLNSLRYQ
jgi:hypothetical protein